MKTKSKNQHIIFVAINVIIFFMGYLLKILEIIPVQKSEDLVKKQPDSKNECCAKAQHENHSKKDDYSKYAKRQCAGQENNNQLPEHSHDGKIKRNNDLLQKISDLSNKFSTLMVESEKYKVRKQKSNKKCPNIINSSPEEILRYKKYKGTTEYDNREKKFDRKLSFQSASLEFKRSANVAEECLDNARSLMRNVKPKCNKDQNSNHSDSDELSSDTYN